MNHDTTAHRRRSIRLPEWDYTRSGAYFVTICTHARHCVFSDPELAAIAATVWRDVAASNGPLDECVIMPNHVHGIIWISGEGMPVGAQQQQHSSSRSRLPSRPLNDQLDSTEIVAAPLRPAPAQSPVELAPRFAFAQRPVEAGSLSAIVRTFKSATAKRVNRLRGTPGAPLWQRNYYEHIVRDDDDLHRIRQYIRDNPAKWAEDPLNPALHPKPSTAGTTS